ncbi:hypothetical protein V5R04_09620 [Jonesiaceae bacterium BS-20]|uniref:Uncharacterized protein n=1 Tax=Jonesiaceae bacterium BS-20 TaxID=3120821 RepID=A0AAU7DSS1_9MICO
MSRRNSLFSGLGIALEETQLLNLGGEFGSSFSLYCPNDYEPDALFVFTPDVMAKLVDATGVSDLEFVDDRLLIYASVDTFYTPQRLAQASELVTFLADKIGQQTRFYRDLGSSGETASDPFRIEQLTSGNSGNLTVGSQGRRIRTRTTGWQKAGITVVSLAVLTAGVYWVTMVTSALTPGGN